MTLPTAAPQRRLRHRRQIDVQVFARDDGLWDVDAELTDVKTHTVPLGGAPREAGAPIHDMLLRLVVNERFDILQAGSATRAMPYAGQCNDHDDVYERLAGLNLMRGFRKALAARAGGVLGCTHLTELANLLPTAVLQAFAGDVLDTRGDPDSAHPPFQIDRCHALRRDGETVRQHYPRWHQPAPPPPSQREPR